MTPSKNQEPDKNANAKPEQIEGEIGQTRQMITNDIKALGDKLSPEALKAEAREALVEVKDAAVDKVRDVKNAAVDKAVEVKNVAVDKVIEVKDAAVDKAIEVKDAAAEVISHTAHEVSEKLDEVGEVARQAGGATLRFVRANAVPLSLFGLGAGLLIANNLPSRRSRTYMRDDVDQRPYSMYGADEPYDPYEFDETYESRRPAARRTVSSRSASSAGMSTGSRSGMSTGSRSGMSTGSGSGMSTGSGSGMSTGSSSGMSTGSSVGERAKRVGAKAKRVGSRAQHAMQREFEHVRSDSKAFINDHPLAVGAALIAVGIGVGALLPSTRSENALLGETRDRFLDEARSAVHEVGEVARETAKAVL